METKKEETISGFELRSIGVQKLLDKYPHWLILKGNFLISVVLIIFLGYFEHSVKFPEFVNSKITIITQNNYLKSKAITGLLIVSKNDLKKIKIGQNVIVKLYDFPYQDFGILEGKVQSILLISGKKDKIYVNVIFIKGLKTSFNKRIPFNKVLEGNAEIIVKESRLIEHIL